MKTGTGKKFLDGAGTDCNVAIKIYGKSRQTGLVESTNKIKLKKDKKLKNLFESGK